MRRPPGFARKVLAFPTTPRGRAGTLLKLATALTLVSGGACVDHDGSTQTPSGAGTGAGSGSGAGTAPTGSQISGIESGARHSCSLRSNGTVDCWGRNEKGQLGDGGTQDRIRAQRVRGLDDAIDLALGDQHTCALRRSGKVVCWGAGAQGQLGDGNAASVVTAPRPVTGITDATQISAGAKHTCARHRDGKVSCWGFNETRQLGHEKTQVSRTPQRIDAFIDAVEVSAGRAHTCVRRKAGSVLCFGANKRGQLGDGSDRGHARPSKVVGLEGAIDIDSGGDASCAVRSTGSVMCWGDTSVSASTRAVAVAGVSGASEVHVAPNHTCAQQRGAALCWGENLDGRLGDGSFTSRTAPKRVRELSRPTALSVGDRFTCAVDGGKVKCWGDEYAVTAAPSGKEGGMMPVRGVEGARALSCGEGFSCAVDEHAKVLCWGANDKGQLGHGDRKDHDQPVLVRELEGIVAVSAGKAHACAARKDGKVYCWGDDSAGQVTPARGRARTSPARVAGPSSAIALGAGGSHTCAVEKSGAVVCWGSDASGQLGDGSGRGNGRVAGLTDAVQVSSGNLHSCAARRGGQVVCWGSNHQGQLGNGAGAAQLSKPAERPVTATKVLGAKSVHTGADHSCALLKDGRAQCWGRNDMSQLGSGTSSIWTNRVPVKGLAGASALGLGEHHACALAGGRLKCWGDNREAQGAGSNKRIPTPANGPALDAVQIAAGTDHSCARTRSGAVVCWGSDARGQLGMGDRGFARTPTLVSGL